MGWLNNSKSWTDQAKTPKQGGLFGGTSKNWSKRASQKAKSKKTCPPVTDCPVKQSLMASAAEQRLWGVRTKKEVVKAKRLAGQIAARQKAGRRAPAWPYAGTYNPTKQKGRGR